MLGSAVGILSHDGPSFQAVIGCERASRCSPNAETALAAFACVGGGSNAIGLFAGFVDDADVRLIGVEPAGRGLTYGDHAASLRVGTRRDARFPFLHDQDENGEPGAVLHFAGLDYPSVGPSTAISRT